MALDITSEQFCPTIGATSVDAVVRLLSESFGDDIDSVLTERYEKMGQNFKDVPFDDERWDQSCGCRNVRYKRNGRSYYKDALLCVNRQKHLKSRFWSGISDYYNLGLDLPVWFCTTHKPKHQVMIISQDPERVWHPEKNLYLSTPWGVHSCQYTASQGARNSVNLIGQLLSCDTAVYFTDYVKFYFSSSPLSKGDNGLKLIDRMNLQNELLGGNCNLQDVLKKEIEMVNPDLLVTFGTWIRDSGFWPLSFEPMNFNARDIAIYERKGATLFHPNVHDKKNVAALKAKDYWPIDRYFKKAFDELLK